MAMKTGHFAQKTFRTSLLAQVLDRSQKELFLVVISHYNYK